MRLRPGLLLCCLLGCQGPRLALETLASPDAAVAADPAPPPRVLRLAAPGGPAETELAAIALLLERGEQPAAAARLRTYVETYPGQLLVRAQLGELLFRLGQYTEARRHFELFLRLADDDEDVALRYRVHTHSRLVEMAEAQDDAYTAHLHRALGLYWLACRRADEPEPESGNISATSLFHRSMAELIAAQRLRPTEARPPLYQYLIWTRLGQPGSARRALAAADRLTLRSELTPAESRRLQVACLLQGAR